MLAEDLIKGKLEGVNTIEDLIKEECKRIVEYLTEDYSLDEEAQKKIWDLIYNTCMEADWSKYE